LTHFCHYFVRFFVVDGSEKHMKKMDIEYDESQKSQIYAAVGEIDAAADLDLPKEVCYVLYLWCQLFVYFFIVQTRYAQLAYRLSVVLCSAII
jgi:hypothetical protein